MPRGLTVNLASNTETSEKNASESVQECGAIKTECSGPEEQVIHRKSARRRVARDIFLVFEEQPRRHGRGCNRKKNQIKSKFGHLKVEDPNTKARAGLLRDIKNEPKNCVKQVGKIKKLNDSNQKLPEKQKNIGDVRTNSAFAAVAAAPAAPAASAVGEKKKKNSVNSKIKSAAAATVNPIFLWAKQDDTRIIEVRCEDYDKRNRIRITKTTTGWRAIPRSDASTSRIVKYFQTPSSLIKLKREMYDSKMLEHRNECVANVIESNAEFCSNSSTEAIYLEEMAEEREQIDTNSNVTKEMPSTLNEDQEAEIANNHENSINSKCGVSPDNKAVNIIENTLEQQEECSTSINSPDQLSENESQISQNYSISDAVKESETVTTNSDTYHTYTSELRLCSKTGLFFSSASKDPESNEVEANDSGIHIDMTQCQMDSENAPSVDSVIGSLNTDATNLKDLLDDADLLQHCNDNVNCDSDLIDSLVKHGCESTLISQTDILKTAECVDPFQKPSTSISSPKDSIDEGIVDNMLPQMIDTVSEPHKCLSFNEAGEIEEENGALFHTLQNFSNAFEKNTIEETSKLNPKAIETINMPLRNATSLTESTFSLNAVECMPKDLSYRKTESENICGQSTESHSQCAVTSSSDILPSPCETEVPIVESGTENIKNFILEQFINLNALNSLPNTTSGKTISDAIDLDQQNKGSIVTELSGPGHRPSPRPGPASEFIETVVIDDNSNDEPAKKKLCNNKEKKVMSNVPPLPVSTTIDTDPDPLTQLQLLLRNTQWKVPDPILVPKDRLGAVLASPAREIPLLITTRPELRLPEAFAYPHIIQNPNILVISMAQLEAILKNEMGMEKTPLQRNAIISDNVFPVKTTNKHTATKPQPKELNTKCSFAESNSMTTDMNTATLAVINQMFWLPYFGQWSQEFLNTLKNPIGLQNQFTNFLTPYNPSTFGLQHLDEIYKTYVKQMSNSKLQKTDDETTNFQTSPFYMRAINAFQNHVDLMLLQKLVQQQMPNTDQPSSSTSTSSLSSSSSKRDQESSASFPESVTNTMLRQQIHNTSHQKYNKELLDFNSTNLCPPDYSNIGDVLNNSLNLQKLSNEKPIIDSEQKKQIKTKPRLTCKSLSNLLEPENRNLKTKPFSEPNSHSCVQQTVSGYATAPFKKAEYSSPDIEKRRQCNKNFEQQATTPDKNSDITHMQGNSSHVHPLFNSGLNGGYNSQWNWTTVTATGE